MKLTVDFSQLHYSVAALGRVNTDFIIKHQPTIWQDLTSQLYQGMILGEDVKLADIKVNNGLLSYKGFQVMLYIPNQGDKINSILVDGKQYEAKRVHVAECKTVISMKEFGRSSERYDVINRIDGQFPVFGLDHQSGHKSGHATLGVCQNCLNLLNYKDFLNLRWDEKNTISDHFSFIEFFEMYSSFFKTQPKLELKQKTNKYLPNWPLISAEIKAERNYTCEECNVELKRNPKLLHLQHINSNLLDNNPHNLKALCADCHKKNEHYGYLYISNLDILKINQYRREQELLKFNDYISIQKFVDTALIGLLEKCRASRLPAPELGVVVDCAGKKISLDLCWSNRKAAVVIKMEHSKKLVNSGWNVFSPFSALNHFDEFQHYVR